MSKVEAITIIDDPLPPDFRPTKRQREKLMAWYMGRSTQHIQAQIGECTRNGYAEEAAPYLAVMWSCSTGAPFQGRDDLPWAKLGTTMGACFGAIFGIAIGMILGALGAP